MLKHANLIRIVRLGRLFTANQHTFRMQWSQFELRFELWQLKRAEAYNLPMRYESGSVVESVCFDLV